MIETRGLRKSFRSRAGRETKTVDAVRGRRPERRRGRDLRLPRPQRRRQDHHAADARHADRAGRRRGHHRRRRPAQRAGRGAPPDRLRRAGRQHLGRVAPPARSWCCRPGCTASARPTAQQPGRRARWTRSSSPSTPTASARRTPAASAAGSTSRSASSTQPKVVFLDEPTTGLDPQSRAHMWDEIRRLRTEGMTVFITTHYLDEADALCDRIAIMDNGEIVAEGTPDRAEAGDLRRRGARSASTASTPAGRRAARRRSRTCASWRPPTRAACGSTSTTAPPPSRRSCAASTSAGHRSCARSSCTGPASTTCS